MSTIKVGINGFGRIGRMILREAQNRNDIKVVAINDVSKNIHHIAYMLKYDSTHGRFPGTIIIKNDQLIINDNIVYYTSEKNPIDLQWKDFNVDAVAEATGKFLTYEKSYHHIIAGAKKVILTGPSKDNTPMFVMGVNENLYNGEKIISNASCTTNCLAPLAKIIHNNFGIIEGLMTTVHAVTATQKTIDSPQMNDWRSGRGAYQNIIPTSTGAAKAVGKVIRELNGKLTGISFRVPIANVSVVDLTVHLQKTTSYKNICEVVKTASEEQLKGIIGYVDEDMVSNDFNGEKLTSIFDAKSGIALNERFVKLIAWYDNETGYSNKVLDLISYVMNK